MSRFIWVLCILLVAVVLGVLISQVPGAMVVQLGQESIAAPLWLAILALVVVCIIFYCLVRIVRLIYLVPVGWRQSYLQSKFNKRQSTLKSGLRHYLLGDYRAAMMDFKTLAAHRYMAPETHYMAAASAMHLKDEKHAREFLQKAGKLNIKDKLAYQLLEVDQAIATQDWFDARAKLNEPMNKHAKNPMVMQRAMKIEEGRGNWTGVIELLPKLKRSFDHADFEMVQNRAYIGAIDAAKTADQLNALMINAPKSVTQSACVLCALAVSANRLGEPVMADKRLVERLNKSFDDGVFLNFARLDINDARRLSLGEKWFASNPPTKNSLLAMAYLYQQAGVKAKADQFFERAVQQ